MHYAKATEQERMATIGSFAKAPTNAHWGAAHHGIIVEGCELCEQREWTHSHGAYPHKKFHQGCVACGSDMHGKKKKQ